MVLDRFSAALKAFTQPNIVNNATNASKNYTYANAGYGAAATGRNRTLQWNKYGAAGALLLSPDMASCVTEFATIANSTDLKLMQDGEVVATSTDYDSDVAIFRMLANFAERNDGRSLMYFHALHLFTTGEAYIEILRNDYGRVGGVDFLNSLNTWYTVVNGRIQSYSYAPSYGGKYATLAPDDVIYDKYPLDLFDEFKGYAPIMHILGAGTLQVMQAAGQTMLAYFENGALPGAIISPERSNAIGDGGVWGEREIQAITNVFARFKGARNQHGLMISPKSLEAQVFDQPDLKKWSDLLQDLRPQIYGVYQIPPSQIGISDNTRFQVSPSDVSQYKRRMARMLSNLERVYNNALIPAIYGERQSVRLEFDKSAFEVVSEENLQRAETAYNLGAISLNELRTAAGYAPDDNIGDLHYVNGLLIPKAKLPKAWELQLTVAPSVYNSELVTGKPLPQPAPPDEVIPTEDGAVTLDEASDVSEENVEALEAGDDAKAITELHAWLKFHDNGTHQKRAFVFEQLDALTCDYLTYAINSGKTPQDAFYGAYTRITDTIHADADIYALGAVQAYAGHLKHVTGQAHEDAVKAFYRGIVIGKAIQATRLDFENAVEDIIESAVAGDIDRRRFSTLLRSQIRIASIKAYRDGLEDGGIEDAELTVEDNEWLDIHIRAQTEYVTNLGIAIYKDDRVTPDEVEGKPQMWFNKSVFPAYYEGVSSASKNGLFEWVLGNAEHCDSCRALSGQRRRMSFWKTTIMPQSDELQCGGFNCKCNLVPHRGKPTRGRLPKWRFSKHHHHAHDHD